MPTGKWIEELAPEPEPPEVGRWIARPRKARRFVPLFAFAGAVFQLPNLVGALVRNLGRHLWLTLLSAAMILVCLAVLVAFVVLPALRHLLARRKTIRDLALTDDAFGEQFPVEATLVADGKPLGSDRGVAWFTDGLIGFSGESFSFVLAASDLAPQWIEARREFPKGTIPSNALGLRNAAVTAYLHFAPLLGHGKPFWDRLRNFVNADEPATGERFWPPLEPYAELPALESVRG